MLFPFTRPFHCDMLLTLWDRNEGREKPPCLTSRCSIESFLAFGVIIRRVYSETTSAVDELWASKVVHSDTTDIWIDIKLKLQCDFDLKDDRSSLTRRSLTALNEYNAAIIFPRHNNDDGYNSTNVNKQLSPSPKIRLHCRLVEKKYFLFIFSSITSPSIGRYFYAHVC